MQTYDRIPGFRYLYRTSFPDAVVARTPAEGLLGVVGKKSEWVFRRNDPEGNAAQYAQMFGHAPLWVIKRGIIAEIEAELNRWQFPQLRSPEWSA